MRKRRLRPPCLLELRGNLAKILPEAKTDAPSDLLDSRINRKICNAEAEWIHHGYPKPAGRQLRTSTTSLNAPVIARLPRIGI
jgi:hypothetical protein